MNNHYLNALNDNYNIKNKIYWFLFLLFKIHNFNWKIRKKINWFNINLYFINYLIKVAEDYNITISTSPKKTKPNIDTSDDSESQVPSFTSPKTDHDDPDL